MKGLIIYESRYGSTQKYACWLKESLGFDVLPVRLVKDLSSYDSLIIGSYIMASKPKITDWVIKNWSKLKDKKLVFFTTSGASNTDPELQENFKNAFPEQIRQKMPYVALNGKLIFKELSWLDRNLMLFAIHQTAKKDPVRAEKMRTEADRVNREDIRPILELVTQKGIS